MKLGKNTLFYFLAACIFLALRQIAVEADIRFFYFLLKPVAGMLEIFSGAQRIATIEGAFLFSDFNVLIDRSCAGFNFMILSFLMMVCMLIQHSNTITKKIVAFPLSLLAAYLLTILVNMSRILVAILVQHKLAFDHPSMHMAIGIFIYLSSLILCYQALHLFLNRQNWSNAKLV